MKIFFGTYERLTLTLVFIISIIYFIFFYKIVGYTPNYFGVYTQISLFAMPLLAGFFGLRQAKKWGWESSVMGKAMIGLSIAELFYGTGFLIWTYYLISGSSMPYPSIADLFFVWYMPAWIYGLIKLSKVIGVNFGLRKLKSTFKEKLFFSISLIFAISVSYYLSAVVAYQGTSTLTPVNLSLISIVNLIYNYRLLVQIVFTVFIYLLSRNYLGGIYYIPLLTILFGFVIHYVAMLIFSYGTTTYTYFNGNLADLMFTIGIYLECLGILNLDVRKVLNNK